MRLHNLTMLVEDDGHNFHHPLAANIRRILYEQDLQP